jgi:GDP-mannose 6-dehydrogenase
MRISVFGLGYVGCVTAACLAHDGHEVTGVDVNDQKVGLLASGRSPVAEPLLDKLLAEGVRAGRLRATRDSSLAVCTSEISMICVGTPSNSNGSLDLRYIERVCREIGTALAARRTYHVVVVRSTVLPGAVQGRLIPILEEHSTRRCGRDFGVCMNPEFLREGSAIDDYYHPSHIIIGQLNEHDGDKLQHAYEAVPAPIVRTQIQTAEMLKYVNNAFHALKVVFGNEIGSLCKAHGVDGREVIALFSQDRKLNISPAYLVPGFAFGGSCLPKDLRALIYRAEELDIKCPMLSALVISNQEQIQRGIEMVENTGRKKIGVLGLSFKAGTDDIRESPAVPLIETLVETGYQVSIFDEHVDPHILTGVNRSFLERRLPHVTSLMCGSLEELLAKSEVVVVTRAGPGYYNVPSMMREDQILLDLAGIVRTTEDVRGEYEGIGW